MIAAKVMNSSRLSFFINRYQFYIFAKFNQYLFKKQIYPFTSDENIFILYFSIFHQENDIVPSPFVIAEEFMKLSMGEITKRYLSEKFLKRTCSK